MSDYEKLTDRELDVSVAEKLMGLVACEGWKRINLGSGGGPAMMQVRDVAFGNPEGLPACPHGSGRCFPADLGYPGGGPRKYSTDDNAARLVRDRIKELGIETIRRYEGELAKLVWPEPMLRAVFSGADHFAFGMQQATPRQQCIAALQALESEQAGRKQS